MSLIPWKTKETDTGLATLPEPRSEFERLVQSFFGDGFPTAPMGWNWTGWAPPLDLEETDKQVVVRAEIPGINAEELDLSITDGRLVIRGEKKESNERKDQGYLYQERRFGSFRREIALPTAVDADSVEAAYRDGVLEVRMQKAQEALPRKIQVKSK